MNDEDILTEGPDPAELEKELWPSATSVGATAHWADRLLRLTSQPAKLPPLAVAGYSPAGDIKEFEESLMDLDLRF